MTNVLSANISRCFGHYALLAANEHRRDYAQAFDESRFRCKIEQSGDVTPANIDGATALAFSLEDLPFKANSIDLALIDGQLARHEDPLLCLREITRALMYGGRLMISDPERYSGPRLLNLCLRGIRSPNSSAVNYSSYTLVKWLEVLGYDVTLSSKYRDDNANPSWLDRAITSFINVTSRLKLWAGSEYAIIAVKREARVTGTGVRRSYGQVTNISHARVSQAKNYRDS